MGKIFVLSVTDHEEYILSRIMEIIAAEPGFDHIVSFHPCNIRFHFFIKSRISSTSTRLQNSMTSPFSQAYTAGITQ